MSLQELFEKYSVDNQELITEMQAFIDQALTDKGENHIPKSRLDEVIAQRNELREELQMKERELNGYVNRLGQFEQIDIQSLQEEKAKLQAVVDEIRRKEWEQYSRFLDVPENHPHYDRMLRIRDDFKFGTDTEPLTGEDIHHNLQAIKPYLKAGYFTNGHDFDNTRPVQGIKPRKRTDLTDMFKAFGG